MEKEKYVYCGTAFMDKKKVFLYYNVDYDYIDFFKRKEGSFVPAPKEIFKLKLSILDQMECAVDLCGQHLDRYKVKNRKKKSRYTSSFTTQELEELYEAVSCNPYLNHMEKTQLNTLVALQKGLPGYIDLLKERLSTVTIERCIMDGFDGKYYVETNKVLIHSEIPEERYAYLLRHEFGHLFQDQTTYIVPIIFQWFQEGMTELVTQEHEPCFQSSEENEYDLFVLVVRVLYELFPDANFLSAVQLGHYDQIYHLLRTKMSEENFYELFVKLSLYFDKDLYKNLNLSYLVVDVDLIFLELAKKESKEIRRKIKNYIRETLGKNMVYRTNYVVGKKKSLLYDKQKQKKVREY